MSAASSTAAATTTAPPKVQPCRYKTGKTLGAGSYSVVRECVHIDTGRYYAAKVISKRLMAGREHMVGFFFPFFVADTAGGWKTDVVEREEGSGPRKRGDRTKRADEELLFHIRSGMRLQC